MGVGIVFFPFQVHPALVVGGERYPFVAVEMHIDTVLHFNELGPDQFVRRTTSVVHVALWAIDISGGMATVQKHRMTQEPVRTWSASLCESVPTSPAAALKRQGYRTVVVDFGELVPYSTAEMAQFTERLERQARRRACGNAPKRNRDEQDGPGREEDRPQEGARDEPDGN